MSTSLTPAQEAVFDDLLQSWDKLASSIATSPWEEAYRQSRANAAAELRACIAGLSATSDPQTFEVGDVVRVVGSCRRAYVVVAIVGDLVQVDAVDGSTKHVAIGFRADRLALVYRALPAEGKTS